MLTLKIEIEIEDLVSCYQAHYNGHGIILSADDNLRAIELITEKHKDAMAEIMFEQKERAG